MELFREERVAVELNADISYACTLNGKLYFGTTDGRVLKWRIEKNPKWEPGEGGNIPNMQVQLEENYCVKKNQKVEKIILVEKESIMIIQINDGIYYAKDFQVESLTLLCKDANICTVNEKNKSDLLVYSMKKKKIIFFHLDNGKYKSVKEQSFNEFITSFLWVSDSLFLTVQKSYYLLRLKKNEKITLYSHEYEQTYKYITLINVNEIFIVCDMNVGVFYDVDTTMPSRKNTITLVDNVRKLISFRFFLCSLNSKGVINFYNVNNQQHVQTICMDEYVDAIVNYGDVCSSIICSMVLLDQEGHDGEGGYLEGDYSPGEHPNDRARYELDLDATLTNVHQRNHHNHQHDGPLCNSSPVDSTKFTNQRGNPSAENNYIYFFNKSSIQVVRCQELFEYLPKCIQQNRIDKGFQLIDNYLFDNDVERINTLNEYTKACAYYLFSKANFALAFVHFQRVDVNFLFLLSFWEMYLSNRGDAEHDNVECSTPKNEPQEVISKPFKFCVPHLCSVEEIIDRTLSSQRNNDEGKMESFSERIMRESAEEKEEEKKKLLKIANNCLVKYLVMKRKEFVLEEGGMMGMYEEEHTVTEMNAQAQGCDMEMQSSDGATTQIGKRKNLLRCIDNLLIKLMVINEWPGFSDFLMNTQNLHIDMDECIRFLKKHSKFVETALMYIRMKRFEEAIHMCATFLCVYNRWLHAGEDQQTGDHPLYTHRNTDQLDEEWTSFFQKQKFTKNVIKGTALHSLLKEMYNILIVLNDSIHMMDVEKCEIKELFENAFPFLIRFNESAFFHFIASRNFLLKPEEILNMFKKMERDKLNMKEKKYMQKYITTFLKYDKMNKEVNTGLVEFYLNDVEMPEQVRQKKILRFLRSSYPLDVTHLARVVPEGQFPLVQALLFGRMDLHYDSLVILTQENLCICEKYCLYHSLLFKDAAKRMSKEDHDKLFASLYHNEKEVYQGLYGQMRKIAEEQEGYNDRYQKNKQTRINRGSQDKTTKKKKLNDPFISDMMRNYHKQVYLGMEKGVLAKLENQRRGGKHRNNQFDSEKDEGTSSEKGEYVFMLNLMEREREDSSDDHVSEVYYDDGDDNFVKDIDSNHNLSSNSWTDVSTGSGMSTDSEGRTSSDGKISSSVDDDVMRKKQKGKKPSGGSSDWNRKNRGGAPSRRSSKKKGKNTNKRSKMRKEDEAKKKEEPFGSRKHRNFDVDMLDYFDVYRSGKNKSCGFFFLLVKVCLDKYNDPNLDEQNKKTYKEYVIHILNKYAYHGDFENAYILEIIPRDWSLSEVLHFLSLKLKKKTNRYMDLHHYHNLIKANYLSASYELIEEKEQRLLVKDKLICQVCKGPIAEKRFAYFSAKVVTHMQCLEKYEEEVYR
ncbi:vacuolar protein sorting-associated protein 3, putative [Plasmodium knowlesi strain H]|uniref:Vacuolar protein sorting-associated protein 3, putative n=3 Tax=Plasmodium knowlesi TaxID=5850 RepID=A0A1A7VCJ8_PLAKH|nr:vacuolar protein sorting-associated protein 3, putative [Plasmodium knowlesi strain H]OTN67708.1 putative Vacuolar protein sorting-associated protein 3 [Plasmodium knowlesi]CAA9990373.1 vacuolar protein sorting-associated protein 3, putative [Plasmodium knowlesi strain H]SBO19579.1 vacuolar protein sorting-associated protein 3, putative [Plasmodium knowlesi strain H]SBO22672.1 vacuolar protein sorting-associated protein 3, putative [Plasmodium knowlesi strain H]VVS79847.1 vacuolar protein s